MKKLKKKLALSKEKLATLDNSQLVNVKGGFTSIGHGCSHANDCSRLHEPSSHVTYHSCEVQN